MVAQTTIEIASGAVLTADHHSGPIYRSSAGSGYDFSQYAYLYSAAELSAAGLTNGSTISQLAWNKTSAFATVGNASFKIYLKNSSTTAYTTGATFASLISGLTANYDASTAIPATTGYLPFVLSTPFVYTGGSIEIYTDWDISAVAGNPATGNFAWAKNTVANSIQGYSNSTAFTNALSTTSNSIGTITNTRPAIQITYTGSVACAGTPTPGNTLSTASAACGGVAFTLSVQNSTTGSGVTRQWQSADDAGFTTNLTNLGTAATQTTTQNSTKYYRCSVTCAGSTAISTPIQVTQNAPSTCYCIPTYTTGTAEGDLISNLFIAGTTLANNSGTATTGPAYTYFNGGGSQTATLTAGTTYTLSVQFGSFTAQNATAWIDYNDNGVFDASERIGSTTASSTTANQIVTFPISLACNPSPGVHRMRVRDVYATASIGSTIDPCANAGYGECEDYDITIAPPPPCPSPSAGLISATTSTQATLNWTIGCAETQWDVHVTTAGGGAPTGAASDPNITTKPFTKTGLAAGTNYEFWVRAVCTPGSSFSVWTGPFTFNTLYPAPPNDDPCSATTLVLGTQICQNTTGATVGTQETASNLQALSTASTSSTLNNTVFFKYTPTVSRMFTMLMNSPVTSTQVMACWVGIYTEAGNCPSGTLAFTEIQAPVSSSAVAGTPTAILTPFLNAGTEYIIMIDGVSGSLGDFCITLYPYCESSSGIAGLTTGDNTLSQMCGDNNSFTYYGTSNQYCLAIEWGANTASKTYAETNNTIKMTKTAASTLGVGSTGAGTSTLGQYWNVGLDAANQLTSPVKVRFYYNPTFLNEVITQAGTYGTASTPVWFKTVGGPFSFSNPALQNPTTGQWTSNGTINFVPLTASAATLDVNGQTYVELSGITSFSGGGVAVAGGVASPLPIALKSFSALETGKTNSLFWETETEKNVRTFVIERSVDGLVWTKLVEILPNPSKQYTTEDRTPYLTTYYRLKNVDTDGKEDRSKVVVVKRSTGKFNLNNVFPNPTDNDLTVQFETANISTVQITITDILGRTLLQQEVEANIGLNSIMVNTSTLSAGTYLLSLSDGNTTLTQRIVKQ